jgi:hypothetical protein
MLSNDVVVKPNEASIRHIAYTSAGTKSIIEREWIESSLEAEKKVSIRGGGTSGSLLPMER